AAASARINYLVDHMKRNPKDLHSRRGLEQLVQNRRKMMKYLRRTNLERYVHCIDVLKLRPLPPMGQKDYR
ncbi:30S ribosomal protein S15, partial [Sphaeroforma arctica JP610]